MVLMLMLMLVLFVVLLGTGGIVYASHGIARTGMEKGKIRWEAAMHFGQSERYQQLKNRPVISNSNRDGEVQAGVTWAWAWAWAGAVVCARGAGNYDIITSMFRPMAVLGGLKWDATQCVGYEAGAIAVAVAETK
ncbi:hypothetical protein PSV08DRAFT_249925 [Bipolaris maydis]|uniref:uncharacterized protein n=1 Tax=Cochliobolus heterostrophus TaxID=5016 RepID=UPI0024D66C80|nr:hypothetical protein PSV08DRAFT_249925 [Bipolaris maydis]